MTQNPITTTPRLSTAWWGIGLRVIIAFLILMVGNLARTPLHDVIEGHLTGDAAVLARTGTYLVTPVIIVALVWAWMRWIERRPLAVLRVWDARAAAFGLVGGFLIVGLAMVPSWVVLLVTGHGPGGATPERSGNALGVLVAFVVVRAFLLQGIPEELLFRGWLFDVLRRRPWVAFAWTSVGFVLPHLLSAGGQESPADHLVYLMMPLGMSILGGALVLRFGHFWWAAGTHGGFHLWLAILVEAAPVTFGATAWVVTGVAQILLGGAVLLLSAAGQSRRPRKDSNSRRSFFVGRPAPRSRTAKRRDISAMAGGFSGVRSR